MDYEIKELTPFGRQYGALCGIGERIRTKLVYKYMDIETAKLCLRNNTLQFRVPSEWADPYEKRFYHADYHNVEKGIFNKELFAYCVTRNRRSEPAWRMYVKQQRGTCVKFSICVGQFRRYLDIYAQRHNAQLFEGEVSYSLTDDELNGLHCVSSKYYTTFFSDFGEKEYLNLLLLKRKAFKYESEIRYFLKGGDLDNSTGYIEIEVPWSLCLDKVFLDGNSSEDSRREMEKALKENYNLCKENYPNSHVFGINVEIDDIYKPFGNITIERPETTI